MKIQKGFVGVALLVIVILAIIAGGVYVYTQTDFMEWYVPRKISGVIEKDKDLSKEYNPNGYGYCFTSDDGKYNCALLGGRAVENLGEYEGKKVSIFAKKHTGPVLIKFPIALDVFWLSTK